MYDLILRGGTVHTPRGEAADTDIAASGGRIEALGRFNPGQAARVLDCAGLHVFPGVIDSQVHFREPGHEHKEDLESGSAAAALGGVVAVFEMPNTDPPTTTPERLRDKLARAAGRMHVDHAFYAGATGENAELLATMEAIPGCCGVKVFMGSSTGSLLVADDAGVARVLAAIGRRAAFHSEDEDRLRSRKALARVGDWSSHAEVRDEQAALISTRRLVRLARQAGKAIHVLHVSTAEEMQLLADHRHLVSVEATPQHLTFAAPEIYERLRGHAQMNPPIRAPRHREALWRAVEDGIVDVIGSDHAPHTLSEKQRPYPESPSGMPGVQTLVPVMLTHVVEGRLSARRFVELTSEGPARVFGVCGKGRIAIGNDADFTVVDMRARHRIGVAEQATRCGWTPFEGFDAKARTVATIVRGHIVARDGEIVEAGAGMPVRFAPAANR